MGLKIDKVCSNEGGRQNVGNAASSAPTVLRDISRLRVFGDDPMDWVDMEGQQTRDRRQYRYHNIDF